MADRSAADRACKDPNPIIDGRKANVNLAYLGAKPRVMQQGKDRQMRSNKTQKKHPQKPQEWGVFLQKCAVRRADVVSKYHIFPISKSDI